MIQYVTYVQDLGTCQELLKRKKRSGSGKVNFQRFLLLLNQIKYSAGQSIRVMLLLFIWQHFMLHLVLQATLDEEFFHSMTPCKYRKNKYVTAGNERSSASLTRARIKSILNFQPLYSLSQQCQYIKSGIILIPIKISTKCMIQFFKILPLNRPTGKNKI